jgi:hypothetical protein
MCKINIKGWYFHNADPKAKPYPDLKSRRLSGDFKYASRMFEPQKLTVLETVKEVGSYFNPLYLQAVVEAEGSLIPFFIDRQKVPQLQALIEADQYDNQVCEL